MVVKQFSGLYVTLLSGSPTPHYFFLNIDNEFDIDRTQEEGPEDSEGKHLNEDGKDAPGDNMQHPDTL